MEGRCWAARVLAGWLMVWAATQARAAAPGVLTIFGDSLSDVGNTNNLTFGISPGSGYYNGRYSNGPLWDEILSTDLGLGAVNYSRNGGRDYAYGGAEAGTGNQFVFPFSIPRTGAQISTYLGQHTPAANELFVLWGGANNFLNNSAANPATVASTIASEITTLASAGAKRFLVPNLPRLGETPKYRGTTNETLYNNLSLQFDADLSAQIANLSSSLNVTIQSLNIDLLFDQALAEPAAFGLTDVTDQAISGAPNPDQYLFWDDVHPTRVMHSILGNVAYDLVAGTVAHTWNPNAATARFGIATNWGPVGLPASQWQVTLDNTVSASARIAQVTTNQSIASAVVRGAAGPMQLEVESGVTLNAAAGLTIQAGGALTGSGTVVAAVSNDGAVAPGIGTLTGTISVQGNYTQSSAGTLQTKLAGAGSSQHDQLQVAGQASLAGTLDVSLINGYTPASTDTFTLATYSSHVGSFDQLTDAAANWSIHYGDTSATAIVHEWNGAQELGGDFVVGSNGALVSGAWTWDGLLIKRGLGTLDLDLGPGDIANNASLAIVDGTLRLDGHGALVLSGFSFGDLGQLTGDSALAGDFGWFASVVPEPNIAVLFLVVALGTCLRRSVRDRSSFHRTRLRFLRA